MCITQLEHSLAFWLILTENKIPITVKSSMRSYDWANDGSVNIFWGW